MTTYSWAIAQAGDWETPADWIPSSSFPNSATADAVIAPLSATTNFTVSIASTETITVDSLTLNSGFGDVELQGKLTLGGTSKTLVVDAGTFDITGTLVGGTVSLESGGTLSFGASTSYGGVFLDQGGLVDLFGYTVTLSGATTFGPNDGATTFGPNDVVDGGFLVTTGSITLADGGAGQIQLLLGGTTWQTSGTVSDAGNIDAGDSSGGNSATIVNNGVFDLTSDDGGIYDAYIGNGVYGNATFINNATLAKTGGNAISHIYASLTSNSTGTLNAGSGTIEIDDGGSLAGVINGYGAIAFEAGTTTIKSGASLTVANILIDGGTLRLPSTISSYAGSMQETSGALVLGGNLTLTQAFADTTGLIALGANTLTLNTAQSPAIFGAGTQYSSQNASIDGLYGTLVTASVVTIRDPGVPYVTYAQLTLGGQVTWQNTGTVNDGGRIQVGDYTSVQPTNIANSGTFNLISDDGGIYNNDVSGTYGIGTLANTGLLSKTHGTGTSTIQAYVSSTGTVLVATGTLEFDGGGTFSGTLSGNGTLAFGNGGYVTIKAGTTLSVHQLLFDGANVTLPSTTATFAGAIQVTGGAVTLKANLTQSNNFSVTTGSLLLSGHVLTLTGSTRFGYGPYNYRYNVPSPVLIDGGTTGSLVTSGSVAIPDSLSASEIELTLVNGLTWQNTGTVSDAGTIEVGEASGATAAINNSGKFLFTSDDGGIYNATFQQNGTATAGSSTFMNTRLLEKTGGYGTSDIYSVVTSTGTVGALTGTLQFEGGGTFSGTITGTGSVAFGGGSYSLAAVSVLNNNGGLIVDGGAVTLLSANTTYGGAFSVVSGSSSATYASNYVNSFVNLIGNFTATNNFTLTSSADIELNGATLTLTGLARIGYQNPSQGLPAAATIDGSGAFSTTGTVSIEDPAYFDSYYSSVQPSADPELVLGSGVAWTNSGIVNDAGSIFAGDPNGGSASITNNAGGIIDFTSDDGGFGLSNFIVSGQNRQGSLSILNNGTIEKTAGTGDNVIVGALTGSGGITVNTGTIEFDGGGLFAGTITGAGTVYFNGGPAIVTSTTLNVANLGFGPSADVVLPTTFASYAGIFQQIGGAVTLNSNLLLTTASTFQQPSGTVLLNGYTLTASGAVTLGAGATFNTPLPTGTLDGGTFLTTGAVSVLDPSTNGTQDLYGQVAIGNGGTWANSGVVTDAGIILAGDANGSTGYFVNSAGATIDIVSTDGGYLNESGSTSTFINSGLFDKTDGSGTSDIDPFFTNNATGIVNVDFGTLQFDNGGSFAGKLTGLGSLAFTGGLATLASAATLSVSGIVVNGATLQTGSSVTYGGVFSEYSGVVNIKTGTTFSLTGKSDELDGKVTGSGTLTIGGGALGAIVTLAGGSVGDYTTIYAGMTLNGYGSVSANVYSHGLVDANGGLLAITGTLGGGGTVQIDAGGTLAVTGAVAVSTAKFTGANATLALGAPTKFTGALTGLVVGDTVELVSTIVAGQATLGGGKLSIGTLNFTVSGSTTGLGVTTTNDGTGDTLLTIIAVPTNASLGAAPTIHAALNSVSSMSAAQLFPLPVANSTATEGGGAHLLGGASGFSTDFLPSTNAVTAAFGHNSLLGS
jgi:hypothetical protein